MYGKIIRTETDDIYDNGVENGQKDLVINMYKNGMSAEMIAEKTQISLETIKQWLPYASMTEAEMLAKLEKSREQGMFRDADLVVSDMRLKYGL